MQINRDGFVYSVAYGWKEPHKRPKQVHLCVLPWSFLAGFVVCVAIILCLVIAATIGMPLKFLFGLLMGERMLRVKYPEEDADRLERVTEAVLPGNYIWFPIERWPTVGGVRILPLPIIVAVGVAWGAWWLAGATYAEVATGSFGIVSIISAIIGVAMVVAGVFAAYNVWWHEWEIWRLVKLYARSAKQRACPILEVVD